MSLKTFSNCDYSLLGGVTKTQFINKEKTIVYAGSMIQKNHKEDWVNHGFVLLDLKEKNIKHFHLNNDYRFVKIKILDEKLMTPINHFPKNLYVEWNITETGNGMESKITKIQNDIKEKYNIIEETYNYNSFTKEEENKDNFTFDLSIQKQKIYAIDWLKTKGTILEEKEQKELFLLIEKYNNKIKFEKKPFVKWKLIKLEFENILCYRKKQTLCLENFKDIHGIVAENNAGKSALFDILTFSLFGKCSRADTYSYNDLININSSTLQTSVVIKDTHNIYIIKRYIINKKLKCSIIKNNITIYENSLRDANSFILSLIGTYDDFMTTCFMAQNNLHNFLLMTGKTQKDFIARIFQLNLYDKLHKLLKNDSKNIKNKIKELKEKISSYDENNIIENINNINEEIKDIEENKISINNENKKCYLEKKELILKPLLFDNDTKSITLLKDNLSTIKNSLIKHKCIPELDINVLKKELQSINIIDNNLLWDEINNLCNKLKELRGKKVKYSTYLSFDKRMKKLIKPIKSSEDFLQKDYDISGIAELEKEINNLLNTKPKYKNYISLDKIYNLYKIKDCDIEKELIKLDDIKKDLDLVSIKKDLDSSFNNNLIDIKNNLLKNKYKLEFKLKNIILIKKGLDNHKYDPKCKYCCNNKFVIDAKNKIKDNETFSKELSSVEKIKQYRKFNFV